MNIHEINVKEETMFTAGCKLDYADNAVILLHGRGGDGEDIMQLARHFYSDKNFYIAPTAEDNAWYPKPFQMEKEMNQPYLDNALEKVRNIVKFLEEKGVSKDKIVIVGFSQGACLSLEFLARDQGLYKGIISFSGGLIGSDDEARSHMGDLKGNSVFIGCSDNDPFIPVERVKLSEKVLSGLGASVKSHIYKGDSHTVTQEELDFIQKLLGLK